ncbi:MAG: 30S ribosomal protein S5 alanine N-acetyltransferase, partial [Aeromonas sobria]
MVLPHLKTARTHLTILSPDQAPMMLDFYRRNRDHLTPWEPLRDEQFYTLSYWHARLQD